MENIWSSFDANQIPYFLKEDEKIILDFNKHINNDINYYYHPEILPVPFVGNITEAEVLLLIRNPGYDKVDNYDNDKYIDVCLKTLNQEYDEYPAEIPKLYCLEKEKFYMGRKYWTRRLKEYTNLYEFELVSQKFAIIEYMPYTSANYKQNPDFLFEENGYKIEEGYNKYYLKSQLYNFQLVKNAIGEKIILVLRGCQDWYSAVDGLKEKVVHIRPHREQGALSLKKQLFRWL